ncbi:hypothetical protein KBD49_08470 [Myxococcota bacterium]|nr:hypothetical protein [Myxococcota bacterium]
MARTWTICIALAALVAACGSSGGPGDPCGSGGTSAACGDVPPAPDTDRETGTRDDHDPGPETPLEDLPGSDPAPDLAPADTADLPDETLPGTDTPGEDPGSPQDPGTGPEDGGTDGMVAPRTIGRLAVDCSVPTVLDASRSNDMLYMTTHFGDLVQQWGITGTVAGVDLTAFPEKMYYGTHPRDDAYLTLIQASMTQGLQPVYSVRIDFAPDSAVTAGSSWEVGLEEGQALAVVVRHDGTSSYCVLGVGLGGSLVFSKASGVTQVEGGTFAVAGSFDVVAPRDLPDVCDALGPGVCCP